MARQCGPSPGRSSAAGDHDAAGGLAQVPSKVAKYTPLARSLTSTVASSWRLRERTVWPDMLVMVKVVAPWASHGIGCATHLGQATVHLDAPLRQGVDAARLGNFPLATAVLRHLVVDRFRIVVVAIVSWVDAARVGMVASGLKLQEKSCMHPSKSNSSQMSLSLTSLMHSPSQL